MAPFFIEAHSCFAFQIFSYSFKQLQLCTSVCLPPRRAVCLLCEKATWGRTAWLVFERLRGTHWTPPPLPKEEGLLSAFSDVKLLHFQKDPWGPEWALGLVCLCLSLHHPPQRPPPFFEAFFGSVQQAEATSVSFRLCEEWCDSHSCFKCHMWHNGPHWCVLLTQPLLPFVWLLKLLGRNHI